MEWGGAAGDGQRGARAQEGRGQEGSPTTPAGANTAENRRQVVPFLPRCDWQGSGTRTETEFWVSTLGFFFWSTSIY